MFSSSPPLRRILAVGRRAHSTTTRRYAPLYVAATRQHVGKTTTSLALMAGLLQRFTNKVGFLKPVGQQSVHVVTETGQTLVVDKDAALVKQYFGLAHVPYECMSPVLIPPGYTRDFLDGVITAAEQRARIEAAYTHMAQTCGDEGMVLCEGTGHVAVGSIVDACNADIASWLGAKMILVANGGLGHSFDELQLNRTLCEQKGVTLAGVIINKVRPDKYEQTRHYLTKALQQKWGDDDIPLLGCIPDRPFLGCPALADLERLFDASLVSGGEHRLRHYRISDLTLVATSLEVFLKQLRKNRLAKQRTLYVCHASRNDILLGYLMESVQRHQQQQKASHQHSSTTTTLSTESDIENFDSAMIVTGCEEYPMSTQVLEIVTGLPASAPPVLLTQQRTDTVMQGIYQYTPKLNGEDLHRVTRAIEHYQPYIDFDLLLERLAIPDDGTVPAATRRI